MSIKRKIPEATESFTLSYDGEALQDHSMSVSDLAPALISLERLLKEINLQINEGQIGIEVRVSALQSGSFEISLLAQYFWENISNTLTSSDSQAILNLVNFVFGAKGVLGWTKKFKGKTPKKVEDNKDGTTTVICSNETSQIDTNVYRAYNSIKIKRELSEVVKPVKREGIAVLNILENGQLKESVEKNEVSYFDYNMDEDTIDPVEEFITLLKIITLSFDKKYIWRFNLSGDVIVAYVEDKDFNESMDNHAERFMKGDYLRCRLQRKQTKSSKGTKSTKYSVLQVLEHIRGEKQMKLI